MNLIVQFRAATVAAIISGALTACASAGAGDTAVARRCTDDPQTGSMLPACGRGQARTTTADDFERNRQVGAPIRPPGSGPHPR